MTLLGEFIIHSTKELFIVHSMYYILTNFLFMDTRLQCQDKLNKPRGQLILKCLFGVFKFFQKTNENNFDLRYHSS